MLKSNEWATIETIKTKALINQGSQEMKTSESYNQIIEEARIIMDKAE
ncbi:hypothetical protein HPHPH42_1020 [Helicobacter pylori Hp H-42]|uniref:Uncharacterized protein n=1 Tax=Helicobacter pylori Hp H-42 TaxID=992047 RepID=A0AB33XHY8_HELPX|nr:hypothetical protein HPHPH42_1020 [Helicobacter pylori Hp H-42]